MKLKKLSHEEKVIIYSMGVLDDMVESGEMEGPILLTKKGKKFYRKLLKKNWSPCPVELLETVAEILNMVEDGEL